MKEKILSNKKLFVIIGAAIALFVAVNIVWWINANASQSDNERTVYKGHHISADKYEFVQGDNLPGIYLDSDHKPNHIVWSEFGDLRVNRFNNIAWAQVIYDHPWTNASFYYGGNGDEGTSEYAFHDFQFIISDSLGDTVDTYKNNRIGVIYDKQSPSNSKTQGARFYFKLDCYDENGNYIATKRTWDGFKDSNDEANNGDVLERAGHSQEHGDLFDDTLSLVGYNDLCNAVKDGRIKISVEKIVLEQDVSHTVVYKGRHIEGDTEGGDKYEFVQGVNMPDFYLDADHKPNKPGQNWNCIPNRGDRAICWNKNEDHPWSYAEFWYGGNGEEGDSSYKFWDFEFIESHELGNYDDRGTGYIGVAYSKEAPISGSTKQGVSFFFKLDCYDENGNYLGTKRTHDGFKDVHDTWDNSDVLQRAGADKSHGDTFREALDLVGYHTLYYAIAEGRIKISIERIVMEQNDD